MKLADPLWRHEYDKGIVIPLLPGDKFGVTGGLAPSGDYFGNPITGLPDLGAVELVK